MRAKITAIQNRSHRQLAAKSAQRLPNGAIFVPKPIQRIFGLRTELTDSRAYRRSIELPGRIIPDPNASGYVQAAIGGRLSPPPGGFPRLGTRVKQGDCSLILRRRFRRSMSPPCASSRAISISKYPSSNEGSRGMRSSGQTACHARRLRMPGLSLRASKSGARRWTMCAVSRKR